MQPFEILTAILLISSILRPYLPFPARWIEFLPALTLLSVLVHLGVEGYRWQMVPLYLLSLGLFLGSLPMWLAPASSPGWESQPLGLTTLGLLLTALALLPPVVFPLPRIPAPTGHYPVGVTDLYLVDESRSEIYSGSSSDSRRLMVRIWYPAERPAAGAKTAPWVDAPQAIGPGLARWVNLPPLLTSHIGSVSTHSYLDVPVSIQQPSYPVLLFSHGWGGFRAQSTFLTQELASQGYIVVAVEHPYAAMATGFPDGSIAWHNTETLPFGLPDEQFLPAAYLLVDQWVGDLRYVLETLESLNAGGNEHRLAGKLDLTRLGLFGHSTGGAAAIEFCQMEVRCLAVFGLDPYMAPVTPATRQAGLRQPLGVLFSERWPSEINWRWYKELSANSNQVNTLSIAGTGHYDFTDMPGMTPLAPYLGLKGPLPAGRVKEIVNAYTLAFFNQYLHDQSSVLWSAANPHYPEIQIHPTGN